MTGRRATPGGNDEFRLQLYVNTDGIFQKADGNGKLVEIIQG